MRASASSSAKDKEGVQANSSSSSSTSNALHSLVSMGQEKGFEVEQNQDYGVGIIDLVWNINTHPALPVIKCGFIVLRANEEGGGDKDWQDNQFSIRKIEEAAMRGIRSGMDKVYLLADNEEMAKSISGKIEWLASFGSLIRLDAISLGMFPTQQQESAVITPSQKRVPQGKKIRKQMIKKREAKIDRYSKPKGRRRDKESKIKKRTREALLNKHNRPKGQRKRKRRERDDIL
jgi:hypothetical protein